MTPVVLPEMPRGSNTLSAAKCPHFDVSKPSQLETFMNCYKKVKLASVVESLKPAVGTALSSKLGLKVMRIPRNVFLRFLE